MMQQWSMQPWIFDDSFHGDACRIRKDHALQNMSLLRQIALSPDQPKWASELNAERQIGMMRVLSESFLNSSYAIALRKSLD
jgi:hypothetical protein